jgi:amyloid beta precursor protein binding protein 1
MKAQSEVYVRLQNIYKAKARQDVAEVKKLVELHPRGGEVDLQEIETYCKNAAFIKLIQSTEPNLDNLKTVAGKYTYALFMIHLTSIDAELNAEFALSPTLIPVYLALKASETATVLTEHAILSEVSKVVENAAKYEEIIQATQEVARAKGGELHNISALTGGMVSQEIIKVITKQYIPIDNTCIFDGIQSRTQVLKI